MQMLSVDGMHRSAIFRNLESNVLVSILIPCHNAERWIAQCIETALAQTWPEKEVVVVDDGSTDGSLAIIRSFGDGIRWESGPNRGGNFTRNRLLELSSGEWLQYLDADDYLYPEKVARQITFLHEHPETDVVFGPVTLEHWSAVGARRELLPIPEPHDPWVLLARWCLPQTGAPLWRRQSIVDAGGWKNDQHCCQEHELYLRLLMHDARFKYCPHSGAIYRQWSEDTVCKRDPWRTLRTKVEIIARLEEHLRVTSQLTPSRQDAINQTRFEKARLIWGRDSRFALDLMTLVRRTQPSFMPRGNAAPASYRLLFKWLGFTGAELVAALRRRVTSPA
jgi:glycosyltransferase involved in cell wall biosynthesis